MSITGTETMGKVVAELEAIFRGKDMAPPPLLPETILDGSLGLESLDFAELVVRLEGAFGKDPFSEGEMPEIRTIADLANVYES